MNSAYVLASIGGGLIGLSAILLMYFNGKVLGVSGIASNLVSSTPSNKMCSAAFVLGILLSAALVKQINPAWVPGALDIGLPLLFTAGIFVGVGTRLGNGCTSGHGVCGIARLSKRSLSATMTFMVVAIFTVYVINTFSGALS